MPLVFTASMRLHVARPGAFKHLTPEENCVCVRKHGSPSHQDRAGPIKVFVANADHNPRKGEDWRYLRWGRICWDSDP